LEWLWHVDENDEPIGRVERDEAHAKLVTHRSGVVFLVDATVRVYVAKRAASKRIFPGCYDTSASFHVSYGESYEQSAQREALEELGLGKPLTNIGRFSHRDPPESQFVAVFVMDHDGEAITLDPAEASSGAFYSLREVDRIVREDSCTPWLRHGFPILADWATTPPRKC
jgi:isopentenyl-diphosphate Delta-isomerase